MRSFPPPLPFLISAPDYGRFFPAAQMWFLGRILPYMIEHIPLEDEHWQNYLKLLEILDLLFAPSISEDEVGYLSVLITEHHQKFVSLYSYSMLLPKHHYMIHMPRMILQ